MCGIIAVVRRPSSQTPPGARGVLAKMEEARALAAQVTGDWVATAAALDRLAARLGSVAQLLCGTRGLRSLLDDPGRRQSLDRLATELDGWVERLEARVDAQAGTMPADALEPVNAALVGVKDALWTLRRDRLAAATAVDALAGPDPSGAAVAAFTSIEATLAALDRIEVRGRDSAGVHVLVTGHGLDLNDLGIAAELAARADPLFTNGATRTPRGHLAFVYKAASEVGELGDNGRRLRAAIAADELLHRAVTAPQAQAMVLTHTRWASVGLINEANAHPVNSEERAAASAAESAAASDGPGLPYAVAALNGDVDNYAELMSRYQLHLPGEITTDAKVIPVLLGKRLETREVSVEEAFRRTVAEFEGSTAVAAHAAVAPGKLLLALRGSGQGLFVGLAEDLFMVASEPYGLVAECDRYLRLDGERPAVPGDLASRGQIVMLDRDQAGTLDGIHRFDYQGNQLPVSEEELRHSEITTRDIDRGAFSHYLLKEISEAPGSFRKTLRGRIRDQDGQLSVDLGPETLPEELFHRLDAGLLCRVFVIGQGTAAVAGRAVAAIFSDALRDLGWKITAPLATELSGFGLEADMRDTLVVAISQSGTTTDTNRTVDLLRARGALVVAVVNRRASDLTHKADGVLYTSDGRDVEMSVASTKAFYAQVAAGALLACALAEVAGIGDPAERHQLLAGLRELPGAMTQVLSERERIRELAQRYAPQRRHWAVVGNGRNRVAAEEVRIKLSELCYKSIACDATEDKKHIDLSSEPLTLVCAAGLTGSAADDVAKEVAIFRAHAGVPVVIASEGETRFDLAAGVIPVPEVHPALAFVLSTVAGHLFGYEAALAIDAQALPLRQARAALERAVTDAGPGNAAGALDKLGPALAPAAAQFRERLRAGMYDGTLSAGTAGSLVTLLHYAEGRASLDSWQGDVDAIASPGALLDQLSGTLTAAIDELTRPVDAIKHQAKTVTVGISRSDETLVTVPLVRQLLAAGAARDRLAYGTLRTVAALDPAVARVVGYTRYQVELDPAGAGDTGTIAIADRGGVSAGIPSRTERDQQLRGTKQLVAAQRQVLAARGRSDGRTFVLVPEAKDGHTTGLVLLHVEFHEHLAAERMGRVLEGYHGRLTALRSAVTETEPAFDESLLGTLPVERLLTEPVEVLADHWTSRAGPAAGA